MYVQVKDVIIILSPCDNFNNIYKIVQMNGFGVSGSKRILTFLSEKNKISYTYKLYSKKVSCR